MQPKWMYKREDVEDYAIENDGECVIAMIPPRNYHEELPPWVQDEDYIVCAFTSPDEAMRSGCSPQNWEYHFCDEPECTDFERFGL
jgi:hypothetical protein